MSIDRIEEIARLLQSGMSQAEIQRILLPESTQRALRTCAVTALVTDELFDSVLRQHAQPNAPELAELAEQGLVEPVTGEVPGWHVPQADAMQWMREWNVGQPTAEPAAELVKLEADLARWYEERGDRLEQLRHLLIADTRSAQRLFRSMFDDADQRRDFALCQDLLDILADPNRITLAGPETSELRLDRSGFLHARQFWSSDYGRSAQFLMPPGLRERTDRLLSGEGSRIWQLYAPGGTGKTIQLQWLVARHCVTSAVDIPCARIDFDVIDPVNVAQYPWLLLLEVADQLDRRWPRRVFERLDRYSSYRGLARRTTSGLAREAAHGLAGLDVEQHEQAVTEIFVRRLNKAAHGRPVLVLVDTVEELMLGSASDQGRLAQLLADLLRDCSALRVVLAGRYDLRKQAPQVLAKLGPVESFELADFAPDQVREYLSDLRGIRDPALHEAVLTRTHGQPFLVALFADFIDDHPGITSGELLRYREPLVQLLIERVIQHIADPNVQWLVRYGVVPRRLRFEDVKAVIWPMLKRSMSGPSDWDDPRADDHDLFECGSVFPFGPPPDDDATLTEVWQRLLSYAARPSWVSPADDGQSLVFHPNVRSPMRDLISRHAVFRDLHSAFQHRFEQLANEDPANRAAYLREAIYHRVQLGDPGAADYWRDRVLRCRDSGDLDEMEQLASELFRTDYSDGLPLFGPEEEPLLSLDVLAEAHVYLAYVAAERARAEHAGPSDPLWSAVQRSLSHADLIRDRAPEPRPVPALEVALQAALLVAQSKPEEAIVLVETALPSAPDAARVDLLRAAGDAYAALGNARAVPRYQEALELADTQGRADQQDAITRSLVSVFETRGSLDKAVDWVRGLAARTLAGAMRAWRTWSARLLIECYQPAAALRVLDDTHTSDPEASAQVGLLRAQAYQMLGRAGHALWELEEAVGVAEQIMGAGRYAQLAQIHQLQGVVLGEMLAVDEAEDCFQLAASLWAEMGFSEGHPECNYLYRRFLIRNVGDLTAASQVATPTFAEKGDLALRWEESTAELRAAQQRPVRPLAESAISGLPPRQQARAISAALARSWSQHRDLLPILTSALDRISPPSARLQVLDELRRCEKAEPADIESLRAAFHMIAAPDGGDPDARLQQGLLAQLDRLSGNDVTAREELNASVADLPPLPEARLARWQWLQACRMLRVPIGGEEATSLMEASADYPLLQAACLLALASRESRPSRSSQLLDQAIARCGQVDRPTRWAADIFWAAGQRDANGSLLATAADLDRQLGRPHKLHAMDSPRRLTVPDLPTQILTDRPGERAMRLPDLHGAGSDLELQRRLVADWPTLASEMGDALFAGPAVHGDAGAEPGAVRLESDDIAAQALLWELAVPRSHDTEQRSVPWPYLVYRSQPTAAARIDTRWLQRALISLGHDIPVDGVLGPATLDTLGAYSVAGFPVSLDVRAEMERQLFTASADRPVAVLLRPEAWVESAVSSHWDSGFDVTDLYAQFGFAVRTVQNLSEIQPPGDLGQIAVLHITGRMDIRGGAPYFDFSPADMQDRLGFKARGTDVRPKDIGRWLRGCRPGAEPVVVLDPPYPGSPYDVPWQLVLRNMFAATLFAEAAAPAIVATGVRSIGAPYMLPIAGGIASGTSLSLIAAALRATPGATSRELAGADWSVADDALAARATAVFAAPSAFTLPPG
jgi:cellulose synthase operon protein C